LINSGSIAGTSGNAVRMDDGGRVSNAGSINGAFIGVDASASMYLNNTNYIHGAVWGVLTAGGTIFNSGDGFTTTGRIDGGLDGVLSTAYAEVGNGYGSIYGDRFGIYLQSGGTISNDIGQIDGGKTAIYVSGSQGYLTNAGNIIGGLAGSGDGVDLLAGGRVTNASAGDISTAGGRAVYTYARNSSGFVTNYSEIRTSGDRSIGVYLKGNYNIDIAGGDVFNRSGASIYGYVGVSITNDGYVSNAGVITGSGTYGLYIKGSGYLNNLLGGTVTGATVGVRETGSYSRVFNAGSIGGISAVFLNGYASEIANFGGGTIAGSDIGAILSDGGSVFNEKSASHVGTISGSSYYGVLIEGSSGFVSNSGVIRAFYRAVDLVAGGSVSNASTGLIDGYGGFPGRGVAIYGATGTVTNSGSINGAGYYGVELSLTGSGLVTNAAAGHISGGLDGVHGVGSAMTVNNAGSITGGRYGVYLGNGGSLSNKVGATISGAGAGVVIAGGVATVTNAGTMAGGSYAARFTGGTVSLVVDPGAVFSGKVDGSGALSSLVLAAGAGSGTISGLGTSFEGFASITEKAGASWRVVGNNSLASSTSLEVDGSLVVGGTLVAPGAVGISGVLANAGSGSIQLGEHVSMTAGSRLSTNATGKFEIGGTGGAPVGKIRVDSGATLTGAGTLSGSVLDLGGIVAQGGTLAVTGSVSGGGSLAIASHATVSVTGGVSNSSLVFLSGGHEEAIFGTPTAVSARISGFTLTTDVMDLTGFVATKESVSGHTMTLTRSGGSAAHLTFAGSYTSAQFSIGTDSHGGTLLKFV
jgi:hypothetical protein